jgi:hypothetical protein
MRQKFREAAATMRASFELLQVAQRRLVVVIDAIRRDVLERS